MSNTLKFGNGQWYGKKDTILAYNDENNNYKPLPFNFDRASSATRVNKDGLIEIVGADQPRVDYLNDSKGALKLEPQRTNYILKSDDVLSTYQSQSGDVSNASESINGFNNSIQIEYDASNNSLVYKRDFTPTSGTTYTISCFVQMNDNSAPIHTVDSNSGDFCLINNNTVVSASDIKTERLGSTNLYRVSATKTASDTNNRFGIVKYSTQSSKGFKVTGFQLEIGYPTSYIPTQGSAVTRIADACNDGGNAQVFNYSEGTFFIKVKYIDDTTSFRISLSDNTNNNKIILATLNGFYYYEVRAVDASVSASIFSNITQTTNDVLLAGTWKQNQFKFFVNGIKIGEDTLGSVPINLYTVRFNNLSTNQPFFGNCRDLRVYNTALTDAELIELTS